MLAVVAPGQGAQKPGFLRPWLELPGAEALLRWWSASAGADLLHAGTEADAETIRDTALTQPLLVAAGLLAARELDLGRVGLVAGHSVGEVTAAALAGVVSAESALAFAGARGRAMARACTHQATGMSAVLGGDPDEVLARLETLELTPANRNASGQVVAAGALDALSQLAAEPPVRARVVPLQVAGAFHTAAMQSAHAELSALVDAVPSAAPARVLLSDADGAAMPDGAVVQRLVDQVTAPVRWDLCQTALIERGVTAMIELPPAGTLAGLAKRELPGIEVVAVKTPEDLPAAHDLIARHGGADGPTLDVRPATAGAH